MTEQLRNLTAEYNEFTVAACEKVLRTLIAAVGEEWRQRVVLVGGMVPLYLYESVPEGVDPHIGTNDLDVGIGVLVDEGDAEAYDTLEKIVADLDFKPELSWRYSRVVDGVTVLLEFLCPAGEAGSPGRPSERPVGGTGDLRALAVRGVELVPRDCIRVDLEGETLDNGGRLSVGVQVANLLPFLMLKSFAHAGRVKHKDAYDVVWTLVAHPDGPGGVAAVARESPIADEAVVAEAISVLRTFYADAEQAGPARFAEFEIARLRLDPTPDNRIRLRRYAQGSVKQFLDTWDRLRVEQLAYAAGESSRR